MTNLFSIALLILVLVQDTQAAKLSVGQIVYFDTTYSACTEIANFAALNDANNGILFLGDSNPTSTAGRGNGKTAISSVSGEPTHTHTGRMFAPSPSSHN